MGEGSASSRLEIAHASGRRMTRFDKLLIANRGEIACRIMRTAKRMGIATVAVYSDADRDAMHVALADEAVRIGPPPARESYLRVRCHHRGGAPDRRRGGPSRAMAFCRRTPSSPQACEAAGLVFVGPSAKTIRLMGSKSAAKALMETSGVPIVPGYHGAEQDIATLRREAERIGYPVLVKASAGGGGRGMRVVNDDGELAEAVAGAKREALSRVRRRPRAAREICRQAAPHRGAGVRRQPRQRRLAVRARMHPAAPPSEGDRGGARGRPRRRSGATR